MVIIRNSDLRYGDRFTMRGVLVKSFLATLVFLGVAFGGVYYMVSHFDAGAGRIPWPIGLIGRYPGIALVSLMGLGLICRLLGSKAAYAKYVLFPYAVLQGGFMSFSLWLLYNYAQLYDPTTSLQPFFLFGAFFTLLISGVFLLYGMGFRLSRSFFHQLVVLLFVVVFVEFFILFLDWIGYIDGFNNQRINSLFLLTNGLVLFIFLFVTIRRLQEIEALERQGVSRVYEWVLAFDLLAIFVVIAYRILDSMLRIYIQLMRRK